MGKGRDKRKKKEDPSKAAKRAAKQAHKLHKGVKKEGEESTPAGFNNEESIEVTLKRIQRVEMKLKTIEEVQNVQAPTPRANAVFCPHPERDNELLLFGGEFWNGEITEAYNDLYFYHVKRGTWAKLSSAVNPPPRSSCQGVVFKHYLLIHGGEFVSQTQSQYLHFKDVWRFDSRMSEWEELKTLKGGPSSRSGHRMVMHKRVAVVFGGFYDNALECHYFNDLWVLSGLDGSGKWTQVKTAPIGETPHARSGHNMAIFNNTVFVYGGYSTEKFNRFKKSEATVHHDLWMITLPQNITDGSPLVEGADTVLPMWTKVRLGGVPPPIRCGVASAYREKKMYFFGGVVDIESPGGKLISTFSNDLFVFHMDTKRFYPVVLNASSKEKAKNSAGGNRTELNDLEAQLNALNLKGDGGPSAAEEDSASGSSDDDDDYLNEDEDDAAASPQRNSAEMKVSYVTRRNGQIIPHRRMDSSMLITGNTLYIYGGQFESGKKEITMSDLFSLNLNTLDTYKVLLSHDLSTAVWMGKETESKAGSWETGSTVVSAVFDMDYDDDEDEEDAEGPEFSRMPQQRLPDALDQGDEAPDAIPAELDMDVTPAHDEVVNAITRGQKKGLKVHKEQLLAQLGASAAVPTPLKDEEFSSFFQRTSEFWETTARESSEGRLSDRRVRKEGTGFARRRYYEARELLEQLALIEEQEQEEARFFRERRKQKEQEWEQHFREQEEQEDEEVPCPETQGSASDSDTTDGAESS